MKLRGKHEWRSTRGCMGLVGEARSLSAAYNDVTGSSLDLTGSFLSHGANFTSSESASSLVGADLGMSFHVDPDQEEK
eukprot:gene23219-biopygen8497